MNKKTLKLIVSLVMLFSMPAMKGQTVTAQSESQDSTLNIIAYFCKNDTMEYHYVDFKAKIKETDTLIERHNNYDFQIIVRDSTSEGYEIEFIPQKASFYEGKEDSLMTHLLQSLYEKMGDMPVIFTVDEYGTLQHIKNWKEIKDFSRKVIKGLCDSLYTNIPELNEVLPRKRFEALMALQFSNEKTYMSQDDELQLLFSLFGNSFKIGKSEVDTQSDAGYPEHIEFVASYEPSSEEYGFENDYYINSVTTTTIPKDDVKAYANSFMGLLMSDSIAEHVTEAMEDMDYTDANVTVAENYNYFFNGWPCEMENYKSIKIMNTHIIEIKNISWTSRRWAIFNGKDDDEETTSM